MRVLGPTPFPRLNEAVGIVCLLGTIFFLVALVSYQPGDASFNTAAPAAPAQNLAGRVGSHIADLALQSLGLAAFLVPGFLIVLAWKWLRSLPIPVPAAKLAGFVLFVCGAAATLSLGPSFSVFGGYIRPGGTAGVLLAEFLLAKLNLVGSVLLTSTCLLISLYLVSSFSVYRLPDFLLAPWHAVRSSILDLHRWMEERRRRKEEAQASREGRTPRRRVEVEEDDLDTAARTIRRNSRTSPPASKPSSKSSSSGLGGADQSRPGGNHVRVQARSGHQVQPDHDAYGRSVPRPAGRIHSDRAHPRQAHGRHRSSEHAREVISLRQILESDEFRSPPSPLTISLGKDINGRIKHRALETCRTC
jgi:DNA segregation ATPase FtsK/SpoIIIE-like protein